MSSIATSTTWGTFDAIVHAATTASSSFNEREPLVMIETIVDGTRRVLELARRNGAIPFLFLSSGASTAGSRRSWNGSRA